MDYGIWDAFIALVYQDRNTNFANENELKEVLSEKWEEISLDFVRHVISSVIKRMNLVVEEEGGPIEHRLRK